MRRIDRIFFILLLIGLFLFITVQSGWTQRWEPYQFKGNERFELKIQWQESGEQKEVIYILDIRDSGKKSPDGTEILEVSYTTRGTLTRDELGPETAFGLWGVYGVSLNMLVVNPAYGFFFSQMDLKVGEKMSFFGAGLMKVIGVENIAGREGFICQFFQPDETGKMVAEWVIDPELALPLRSKIFDDFGTQGEVELVNYLRY